MQASTSSPPCARPKSCPGVSASRPGSGRRLASPPASLGNGNSMHQQRVSVMDRNELPLQKYSPEQLAFLERKELERKRLGAPAPRPSPPRPRERAAGAAAAAAAAPAPAPAPAAAAAAPPATRQQQQQQHAPAEAQPAPAVASTSSEATPTARVVVRKQEYFHIDDIDALQDELEGVDDEDDEPAAPRRRGARGLPPQMDGLPVLPDTGDLQEAYRAMLQLASALKLDIPTRRRLVRWFEEAERQNIFMKYWYPFARQLVEEGEEEELRREVEDLVSGVKAPPL